LNIFEAASQGLAFWDKWTADSTGVASQIRVYGYYQNGNVKVALYSDNGGSPGTVLAKQDTSTAITTNQWNTIILSSTAQVIQGTTYWIAFLSDVRCVAYRDCTNCTTGVVDKHKAVTYSSWTWTDNPSGLTESNAWYLYTQVYGIAVETTCGDGIVNGNEQCDGGTCCDTDCTFKSSSTECRASAGVCDVAETCTGSSAACPADAVQPAQTECRASAGVCDVAEVCDGSTKTCPTDSFLPDTTLCRASGGVCDIADYCSGSSASCTVDAKSNAECRASAGDCDIAEVCDGVSNDCPADAVQPNTFECRASAGVCDLAETCTGSSATCPSDAVRPNGYVCAVETGQCDADDTCDGTTKNCNEIYASSGTPCNKATCGAECDQNSDCTPKLDGDSCKYGGTCNTDPASCSCSYTPQYCPTPGTVTTGTCYFGTQSCIESGCGLSTKSMGNYDTCSPTLGPIDTIPHGLYGFLPPAKSGSVFNRKQNSTIPLKFQYTGSDGNYVSDAIAYAEYSTDNGSTWKDAVSTSNPTTSNLFRYDSSAHQYIFNLATKNLSIGTLKIKAWISSTSFIIGTITLR